ncbi:MAG: arginine--tRNA ligase [Chloroflexota bacterium]|nr:arginine--tRNA ligase [Chloroflexota bacterium]
MVLLDVELRKALIEALHASQKAETLPASGLPEDIAVEHPKDETLGDFATPMCMKLAGEFHMPPLRIAEIVAEHLPDLPFLGTVEVAPPGFINFRLSESWLTSQVEAILNTAGDYGKIDLGEGRQVQVEYVSANPTGPLHMGSARNAVLGDALASVLETAGYDVQREYYVNDAGSRMQVFYETLYARYAQALGENAAVPEDGYHGPYVVDIGEEIAAKHGKRFLEMPKQKALEQIGAIGLEYVIEGAREDLGLLGIEYDRWFSEKSLYENGQFEQVMTILKEGGYLYEHEGATWLKATALGGEKDEVVIRSDGTPGYFASDIAYHYNKFVQRGFERVVDIWGADHQGHVPRMKAMMKALSLDPDRLEIIIYQLVTLKRGGEIVRLSKRTGDIVTLREVLDEVGSDAMRYFLLSRSADSQMEFDIDLAKERSQDNPVYYIQYAHARICSILRRASRIDHADGDVALLTSEPELALIRQMLRLPEVVRLSADLLAPHHLTYYAYDLAGAFHTFYRDCRVLSSDPEDEELTKARLKLVRACKIALARALEIMGMSAPERM